MSELQERQFLFFVEFDDMKPGMIARRAQPFAVPFAMNDVDKVWTLFRSRERNLRPELPFSPAHHVNAFLEDPVHDWRIDGRTFKYGSRVADDPVWVLVELKEKVTKPPKATKAKR